MTVHVKKTAKNTIGTGKAGPGRPRGVPNKTTLALKDAILEAAAEAGGEGGLVAYLKAQATANPNAFMGLLGKILPRQLTGDGGGPIVFEDTVQRDADEFTHSIAGLVAKHGARDKIEREKLDGAGESFVPSKGQ